MNNINPEQIKKIMNQLGIEDETNMDINTLKTVIENTMKRVHNIDRKPLTRDKTGRNELCPCNSGKKYKKCCHNKYQNI
jgi:preprotein translocase subunit SecA